jgi:hypothetical protein
MNPEELFWNSSRPEIAPVNVDGTVTAVKAGFADIYAFAYGYDAICKVTVLAPGNASIEGTVDNAGTGNVRINLYVKVGEKGEIGEMGKTKRGIIGGYVLLATIVPNDDGEYSFNNLPEGLYLIDVEIDDYESEASAEIKLSEGETRADVNFVLDEETGTVAPKVVTGTVEMWHAASLQIYPNPFTDVVHISGKIGENGEVGKIGKVQVINTVGAIVHTQKITSFDETIHLGHLPAGMYIIRLENGKTTKIIKIQ